LIDTTTVEGIPLTSLKSKLKDPNFDGKPRLGPERHDQSDKVKLTEAKIQNLRAKRKVAYQNKLSVMQSTQQYKVPKPLAKHQPTQSMPGPKLKKLAAESTDQRK